MFISIFEIILASYKKNRGDCLKNKWAAKGIIGILVWTIFFGTTGCGKKTDKEPISDENAISTVKTL